MTGHETRPICFDRPVAARAVLIFTARPAGQPIDSTQNGGRTMLPSRHAQPAPALLSRPLLALYLMLAYLGACALVRAQAPDVPVFSVQEDWELVVGDPDPNCNAPQVTCVISPVG